MVKRYRKPTTSQSPCPSLPPFVHCGFNLLTSPSGHNKKLFHYTLGYKHGWPASPQGETQTLARHFQRRNGQM